MKENPETIDHAHIHRIFAPVTSLAEAYTEDVPEPKEKTGNEGRNKKDNKISDQKPGTLT